MLRLRMRGVTPPLHHLEVEHRALLYYRDTLWLSRTKVLHRVIELKEEIVNFISYGNNNDEGN
jgi:hypothetical protein